MPADTLDDLQTALTTALHDSTGTGSGGVDWTFSIQDKDLDFLGAGETLTVTYDVTVSDGITSSTQNVTITATGADRSAGRQSGDGDGHRYGHSRTPAAIIAAGNASPMRRTVR